MEQLRIPCILMQTPSNSMAVLQLMEEVLVERDESPRAPEENLGRFSMSNPFFRIRQASRSPPQFFKEFLAFMNCLFESPLGMFQDTPCWKIQQLEPAAHPSKSVCSTQDFSRWGDDYLNTGTASISCPCLHQRPLELSGWREDLLHGTRRGILVFFSRWFQLFF